MHREGILILHILENRVCKNFDIDAKEIVKGFKEYMPKQDRAMLRESLLKVYNDLKDWDGGDDGVEIMHRLYKEIGRSVKGVPGNVGAMREFVWSFRIKKVMEQPQVKPMVKVTVNQIIRDLEGYVNG